jgi:hypothetical protein
MQFFFLPGEDEAAFWARVDRAIQEQGAQGELEIEAIKTAVYSRVTKERAINAQAIAVTEARNKIEENYKHQKHENVNELIENLALSPKSTVQKLMDSTQGCAFLIRELKGISKHLIEFNSLSISHRVYCLQLTRHEPGDLFTDPVVRRVNRAYLAALQLEPGDITTTLAAKAFKDDRPADMSEEQFIEFMTPLVTDLPTADRGCKRLKKFLTGHIQRLEDRKELMRYREERELSAALGVAQSPCDRESITRDGYINRSDRTFNTSVRLLLALKQERRKHGDESPADRNDDTEATATPTPTDVGRQGPDGASRPEETAPQAEPVPAVNEEKVNEPGATEVVIPVVGYDADRWTPTEAIGPAPVLSPEDHAAIKAEHDRMMEFVRKRLDERSEMGPPDPSESS